MGGNPLQEGILADNGWKPRDKRDESFASVQSSLPGYDQWLEQPYQERWDEDDETLSEDLDCDECGHQGLEDSNLDPDLAICPNCHHQQERHHDMEHYGADNQLKMYEQVLNFAKGLLNDPQYPDGPKAVENYLQQYEQTYPEVAQAVRESVLNNNASNLENLVPGSSPDAVQDDSFSVTDMHEQVRHKSLPREGDHSLQWQPGGRGRGLFIDNALHTWPVSPTPENPQGGLMHSEYLQEQGADPSHAATGFEIEPDGSTVMMGQRSHDLLDQIKQADPRLTDPNDDFTFGHRMTPYSSWLHQSDSEFQTESVIPPGGHSAEVVPYMSPGGPPGFHNGSLGPLAELGVNINGEPITKENFQRYFGATDPAVISHPNPKVLELAKHISENGSHYGREDDFTEFVHPHHGQVSAPEGISDDLHQALGSFGAAVEHPETGRLTPYRRSHQEVRPALQGDFRIGTKDPELTQHLVDFSQTGDKAALLAYQQQKQGSIHQAWLGPVGDAVDTAVGAGQDIGLIPENASLGELAGTASWLIPGGLAAKGLMKAAPLAANAIKGTGAAGGILNKAKGLMSSPYVKGAQGYMMADNVGDMASGASEAMQPPPTGQYMQRGLQQLTHERTAWHPSSDPVMHEDPKEINDGDNSAAWDPKLNGGGGADAYNQPSSSDDKEWEKHFPKLFLYALSDESVNNDPDPELRALTERLLKEHDGDDDISDLISEFDQHLDQVGSAGAQIPGDPTHEQMQRSWANSDDGRLSALPQTQVPGMNPGHVPTAPQAPVAPQAANPVPNEQACPRCGSPISPEATTCPSCGQGTGIQQVMPESPQSNPQMAPLNPQARTAASHQGPHNNEQFAAVAELLHGQGREDEVPEMLAEPWNYAEELAEAQKKQIKPPIDDTLTEAPPEPPVEAAPPGATMPVPGMTAPEGGPPGAGPMMAAVEKYATPDSYAPRCPKCDSGTTGFVSTDGDCECHNCGNTWKVDDVVEDDTKTGRFLYVSDHSEENPLGIPAAEQDKPRDIEQEQDPSMSWTDQAGDPLHVGEQYEMRIPGVSIPDIVRIKSVKPSGIEVEYEGEYGINHSSEIDRQEAEVERYEFSRLDAEAEAAEEAPGDPAEMDRRDVGPGDQTDLSSPHVMMTHVKESEQKEHMPGVSDKRNRQYEHIKEDCVKRGKTEDECKELAARTVNKQRAENNETKNSRTAGANYSQMEQGDFIHEQGQARNRDKLNLAGTHYEEDVFELDENFLFGL